MFNSFWIATLGATVASLTMLRAAEMLLQEGFNTDGSKANPSRYTISGGGVFEPPFVDGNSEGIPSSQLGPVYWAHSFQVSFVGVPAATPARRVLLAWAGSITAEETSLEMGSLIDNAVKWLLNGKARARVVFSPDRAAAPSLADRIGTLGHTVVDDNATVADTSVSGDLIVRTPLGADPSRFGKVAKPLLVFSGLDFDDLLVSSVGTSAYFEPGRATISASAHPIAAGIPATFPVATGTHNWQLLGNLLAEGSVTVARFTREVPPTVASLADVDAMAAGTKQSNQKMGTVTTLDFSADSPGDWEAGNDYPLVADATAEVLGLVARGQLNVSVAGRYSFALGSDDGARLRIDVAQDGLSAADGIISEDAVHTHLVKFADVSFPAAGLYEFEVAHFNAAGGGGLELSVSTKANGADTSAVKRTDGLPSTWELIGAESKAKVKLAGVIGVTTYFATGTPDTKIIPLMNVVNGPTDSPAGSFFGGGPFVGFEGAGFFAGSALNKYNNPTIESLGSYRSVRLKPVNVTGKPSVKVTVGLAATFLDFETTDYLRVIAYPDGEDSDPVTLADFSAPNGSEKYFADVAHNNAPRLGLRFLDATYEVPPGAKNLIIEVRATTSFWNETVAFDNIRITSGDLTSAEGVKLTASRDPGGTKLDWTGGVGPFLVQFKFDLNAPWGNWVTTTDRTSTVPQAAAVGFFRIQDGPAKP